MYFLHRFYNKTVFFSFCFCIRNKLTEKERIINNGNAVSFRGRRLEVTASGLLQFDGFEQRLEISGSETLWRK